MFIFLRILLVISLCHTATGASAYLKTIIPFSKVTGFRPSPNLKPAAKLETIMFTQKDQFEQNFERIPGKKTSSLNFTSQWFLCCYGVKSQTETSISLEKVLSTDGILKVYFKVIYGKKSSNSAQPFCLYSILKDHSARGIDYYINNKLVQELRN